MGAILSHCSKAPDHETCHFCDAQGDVLQIEFQGAMGVTPLCRKCLLEGLEMAVYVVRECV